MLAGKLRAGHARPLQSGILNGYLFLARAVVALTTPVAVTLKPDGVLRQLGVKALCDLQCARLLLTYGGDAYNIAFHCQQAIEKALKGYLLYRTGRHFDGHNLTYLCRQAIRLDPDGFSEYLDESAALNDLYIETRYPTDLPFEINEVEIRRYLDMAERMFAAIRRQLYAAGRPHPVEGEES